MDDKAMHEERVASDRVLVEIRVSCGWPIQRLSGY
jgi:hypothetical protein